MSVKIMSLVWDCDLPREQKFILLAFADHANDNGDNIYPGLDRVAWKTGYSRRQIQRVIDELEQKGIMKSQGKSRLGTEIFSIVKEKLPTRPDYLPNKKTGRPPKVCDILSPTLPEENPEIEETDDVLEEVCDIPEKVCDISEKVCDIAMSQNPSLEPSLEPSNAPLSAAGLSAIGWPEMPAHPKNGGAAKALQNNLSKQAAGELDLGWLAESLQPLAKAFIKASSIIPTKFDYSRWRKDLIEISGRNYTPLQVENAVAQAKESELEIKAPGSIIYALISPKPVQPKAVRIEQPIEELMAQKAADHERRMAEIASKPKPASAGL